MWKVRIHQALEAQRAKDRYRERKICQTVERSQSIVVDEQVYLNFSSNDYLGLAHHPQMIDAAIQGAKESGVGSGGSPHVTGYSAPLAQLEEKLASWLGYDAAIVYPSGFTANQAVIKLLVERHDQIIADRLSHASLLEAAMLSPGRLYRFKHNDLTSLSSYLDKDLDKGGRDIAGSDMKDHAGKLVITEGIFSMDGDHAPLDKIAMLSQNANALLMVDDAHGIGICGKEGRGSCDLYGIKPDILVVTFGKAFGCSGAALLLSKELAAYFVQFSKPLIYSTAIAPMQAAVLLEAITLIESNEGEKRRETLKANIAYFRQSMEKMLEHVAKQYPADLSLDCPYLLDSNSPIQPLVIGEDQAALNISKRLREKGLWVSAIRPPTVAPKTARLRMTITAEHDFKMIDQLVDALAVAILDESQTA